MFQDNEIVCDRCGEKVDGEFIYNNKTNAITATSGFYVVDTGSWARFAKENEKILCDACMWTDELYIAERGNIFESTVPPKNGYTIHIDGEKFIVRNALMKVSDILAISGIRNPDDYYICRVRKNQAEKDFRGKDTFVPIYNNAIFVSVQIRFESQTA